MNSTNDMNGMDMETKDNNDKKMNENTNVNNNPGSTRLFGGAGGAGRFGAGRGPGNINMPGKDKKFGNPIKNGVNKLKGGGRAFGFVVLALIVILTVMGGFYRVDEQETAVVTMFGNVIRTDTAGLYFKIPWIQQVTKVDTTIHGTGIGYAVNDDGQSFTVDTEGIMITSDFNLIDIDFYMEYRVSDPVAYLFNSKQPEYILKNVALAAIRSTVIDFTVDDAMTTGKAQIQSLVKRSRPPSRARTPRSTTPTNTRTSRFPLQRQTPTRSCRMRRPRRLPGSRKPRARSPVSTPCIRSMQIIR